MPRVRPRIHSWLSTLLLIVACSQVILAAAPEQPPQEDPTQEQLVKLRDEKKATEVFTKTDWEFGLDAALARAKKEKKLVFAYFTRSFSH